MITEMHGEGLGYRRIANHLNQLEIKNKVQEVLSVVGLENLADRMPQELSGGQQQRVFLARDLAQESAVYLMDEPFAGVDAVTEKTIISILQEMKKAGKTLMVVHHDLASAKEYFDQLLLLNMRKVAFGSVSEVYTHELLQKTYGGKLAVLSEMATEVAKNPEP